MNDPQFAEELKQCTQDPKSDEAREMESWVSRLIHKKSSKNIPFSTVQ
jgi:hypothetical protein